MKYYFITYQATTSANSIQSWNACIDISPMEYIKTVEKCEDNSSHPYWRNFVITNTCEITKKEFEQFKDEF